MTDIFANLPRVNTTLKLDFTDARGCKKWMQLLPLINVSQTQLELREMLNMLNFSAIHPIERLRILELLRDTVQMVQEEIAKKYVNRPTPLYPGEQAMWTDVVGLWDAMALGYLHVLKSAQAGEAGVSEFTPLIHERVLRNFYFIWREYAVIYAQRPPELMTRMHQLYQAADERGYASNRIKDSQYRLAESSSCEAAYVQALLLEAINPNMMSVKQIYWIDRLLERWSQHAPLWPEPVRDSPYESLGVELAGSRCLQAAHELEKSPTVRYVDNARLGQSLKKRIRALRQGESPAQLGLGEEFSATACENAMLYMFQQWCEKGAERGFPRYQAAGKVEVATQLSAIHTLTTGKPFTQPERAAEMSGKALRDMQLFGHVSESTQLERADTIEYRTETWDILDQSAMGCRLGRPINNGGRVSHNQLFGVKMNKDSFNLGSLRWLSVDPDTLMIGVSLMPGVPQPVSIRSTGLSPTGSNKYIPALLLPAIPALKSPATLVLPPGWYRPTRVLEIYAEPMPRRIRVDALLERGPDYERITFIEA